jgi:hypothetical protein
MLENKKGELSLTYYIPDEKMKFQKKQELFDCCENNLILKTFNGIHGQIIQHFGGAANYKKHLDELSGLLI